MLAFLHRQYLKTRVGSVVTQLYSAWNAPPPPPPPSPPSPLSPPQQLPEETSGLVHRRRLIFEGCAHKNASVVPSDRSQSLPPDPCNLHDLILSSVIHTVKTAVLNKVQTNVLKLQHELTCYEILLFPRNILRHGVSQDTNTSTHAYN